jgi:hypothetical protein
MTATITRATVVGGHDGRAEIEVELTYDNGGTSTISLDEEACIASLDDAGVGSLDELLGQPWNIVLAALERSELDQLELIQQENQHARSRHS